MNLRLHQKGSTENQTPKPQPQEVTKKTRDEAEERKFKAVQEVT